MFSDNIFVGYNPKENFHYYEELKGNKEYFINAINQELVLPDIDDDAFVAILIHDPDHINNTDAYQMMPILSQADLIVSGHNHNGLLPSFASKFPGTSGLVNAQTHLFSKYVRGFSKIENTYSFISGGVTKIAEGFIFHGIDISKLNHLYAPNIDFIDIKSKTLVKK